MNVFRQHQLLNCQTIEQCLILDANVHKEGKPHADKKEEVGKQVFIAGRPICGQPLRRRDSA